MHFEILYIMQCHSYYFILCNKADIEFGLEEVNGRCQRRQHFSDEGSATASSRPQEENSSFPAVVIPAWHEAHIPAIIETLAIFFIYFYGLPWAMRTSISWKKNINMICIYKYILPLRSFYLPWTIIWNDLFQCTRPICYSLVCGTITPFY